VGRVTENTATDAPPTAADPVTALRALGDRLDRVVHDALEAHGPQAWRTPTPAAGWTVATQVAHLLWTDEVSLCAAREPDRFARVHVAAAMEDPAGYVDAEADRVAAQPAAEVLGRWRRARTELADTLASADPGERIPWFGPPMRPRSMATARLMETWAHGTDLAVALGVAQDFRRSAEVADALPHVARLGVRTRDFAHVLNGLEPPAEEYRVELRDAAGRVHAHGPDDAAQRVTGGLEDFCLLVTRRVHRSDTDLVASGEGAERWLGLAQAFAGPPGTGPAPGSGVAEVAR